MAGFRRAAGQVKSKLSIKTESLYASNMGTLYTVNVTLIALLSALAEADDA